jgi:hypothetical protein
MHEWFGYSISYQITNKDVKCESQQGIPSFLMIVEGKVLIQQIAAYTAKEIV